MTMIDMPLRFGIAAFTSVMCPEGIIGSPTPWTTGAASSRSSRRSKLAEYFADVQNLFASGLRSWTADRTQVRSNAHHIPRFPALRGRPAPRCFHNSEDRSRSHFDVVDDPVLVVAAHPIGHVRSTGPKCLAHPPNNVVIDTRCDRYVS